MIKFFVAPYLEPTRANYQHGIIALAEGLRELGIPFVGNIDYWYDVNADGYLIQRSDDPFEIGIYAHGYVIAHPDDLGTCRIKVLVDMADGFLGAIDKIVPAQFTIYLKAHFNRYFSYPRNVYPWAFGLTSRMMEAIDTSRSGMNMIDAALLSFRVDHPLRGLFTEALRNTSLEIVPFSQRADLAYEYPHYWAQSGRRHDDQFFEAVNNHQYVLAYGGYFCLKPTMPRLIKSIVYRLEKRGLLQVNSLIHTIYQYDSWRFWESLYGDSIPIHANLDDWGLELPVMPIANKHYLSVDLKGRSAIGGNIDLAQISADGKQFAKDYFSPRSVAERLLTILDDH